jgi:NCAIR mutase (PurE)-related protein
LEGFPINRAQYLHMLRQVQSGGLSPEEALHNIIREPFEDLGYAKPDHHRALRQGAAEVIYGAGKTKEQIAGITEALQSRGCETVLVTRTAPDAAAFLRDKFNIRYDEISRVCIIGPTPPPDGNGAVVIATGGTSDMPVAEEAALTAETLGNRVIRLYDVGVAGLHRLLGAMDTLIEAKAVVAVAGMEGALASVIGGLVSCPVIGVPTSVGYGASFGGLSALLSMLNSCASGVSVVNIDNGFGAGYLASIINHMR